MMLIAVFFVAVHLERGSIGSGEARKLNKLINKVGSVKGCILDSSDVVMERRTLKKPVSILHNASHPRHDLLVKQHIQQQTPSLRSA